jgi:FtsZ-binding cell division protein ZapB
MIDLRKQIKTLEAELDAVKSSRDIYQRENTELKKQCKIYENRLKKLGAGNAKS